MCGLISFLGRDQAAAEAAVASMRHRGAGPAFETADDRKGWTLGRTRLPIVGVEDGGDFTPPYVHAGWTFLFVGEILNYKDFLPSARCDVEVLARLWVQEGPACLRRFDGFWSVVALPPVGTRIYAATDFLGKKPLYFRKDRLAFASEIKALAGLGPMTPDPVYFSSVRKWGYHAGERTWAKEVVKVPPGALWEVSWSGDVTRDDAFDRVEPDPSLSLFVEMEMATRRRVISSEVPVGILLSGGLDSSIVYKLATRHRADLRIYHAPNAGDSLDALGVKEQTFEVAARHDDLETVLRANEGPVDLGSMLPQYRLGQAVRETVALSGDGADELFGGYRRSAQYDSQGSDVFEELPGYHCPRLDKLMMAGTVELRSPFMARGVLAAALALPYIQRQDKRGLRHIFEGLVPPSVAWGKKVPLKSEQVVSGGDAWRDELCKTFLKMAEEGRAV